MAYKGAIRAGTTVEARLLLDHTASGPAFLLIGYGRLGGSPSGDGDVTSQPTGSVPHPRRSTASGVTNVVGPDV